MKLSGNERSRRESTGWPRTVGGAGADLLGQSVISRPTAPPKLAGVAPCMAPKSGPSSSCSLRWPIYTVQNGLPGSRVEGDRGSSTQSPNAESQHLGAQLGATLLPRLQQVSL